VATKQKAGRAIQSVHQAVGVHVANRQRLALTAQMQQKLQLLHMSSSDLNHFIAKALERNPLLVSRPSQPTTSYTDMGGYNHQASSISDLLDKKSIRQRPTLQEHVREQIIFSFPNAQERAVAFYLSDVLDEEGYFRAQLAQCAHHLGVTENLVDKVFSRCQNFDPPGLFARSLAECLALQLKRLDLFDVAFAKLLQNLTLLAQRDFSQLARLCNLTQDELMRRCATLKKLDPKPGLAFAASHEGMDNPPIITDAFLDLKENGQCHVTLNDAALPKLILHQDYSHIVGATKEERQFITTCRMQAHGLIRALDARAQTLLNVISAIVNVQKDFLYTGPLSLQPLTLTHIATTTGLHESTISRAIAHKYVTLRQDDRERGTYPLHYFFSNALPSIKGKTSYAAKAIEARLAQLIATEGTPLSDEALAKLLREEGVAIARRTITKYREKLHIAPSNQRKREKNFQNNAANSFN